GDLQFDFAHYGTALDLRDFARELIARPDFHLGLPCTKRNENTSGPNSYACASSAGSVKEATCGLTNSYQSPKFRRIASVWVAAWNMIGPSTDRVRSIRTATSFHCRRGGTAPSSQPVKNFDISSSLASRSFWQPSALRTKSRLTCRLAGSTSSTGRSSAITTT